MNDAKPLHVLMANGKNVSAPPLTLSLSPWERERCCTLTAMFGRSFSQWEKDRMRGNALDHYTRRLMAGLEAK